MMLAVQLLLNGILLYLAMAVLGAGLAFWFRREKKYLLKMLAAQVLLGIGYWTYVYATDNAFINLMKNSTLPPYGWILLTIAINTTTAFFCIGLPFYGVRKFLPAGKRVTAAV